MAGIASRVIIMVKMLLRTIVVLILMAAVITVAVVAFMHGRQFGRLPRGERLARIERSPNYRDGAFRNRDTTIMFTSKSSLASNMLRFLFGSKRLLRPEAPIPSVRTDLSALDPNEELIVWFGHSSYLLQTGGRRILVDPVFVSASPVWFVNRPFRGADAYGVDDMPPVDLLVITHDHWDHLDYRTLKRLCGRIGRVVCPLGVGEHLERWGFDPDRIDELDWDETAEPCDGLKVYCMPSRHFSGRSLRRNATLWASYVIESSASRIYVGGDGGYGSHYAEIGRRFGRFDLAVLENGQYDEAWRNIHMMPRYFTKAVADLNPAMVVSVHNSKYALARHPWYEPLENAVRFADEGVNIAIPSIGEPVRFKQEPAVRDIWWTKVRENVKQTRYE